MWKVYALVAALVAVAWVLGYHAGFQEASTQQVASVKKYNPETGKIEAPQSVQDTRPPLSSFFKETPARIVSITSPDGRTCAVEYDANGRPHVTERCDQKPQE
jgi:YD repeat-containing protein